MEAILDSRSRQAEPRDWRATMQALMFPEHTNQCVEAHKAFVGARKSLALAQLEFKPYEDRGLTSESVIQDAFVAAMDKASGRGGDEIAQEFARALMAWKSRESAESGLKDKKIAMDAALDALAVETSKLPKHAST